MTTEVILYPEALEFRSTVTTEAGGDKTANYLSMWSDGENGFVLSKKAATNSGGVGGCGQAPGSFGLSIDTDNVTPFANGYLAANTITLSGNVNEKFDDVTIPETAANTAAVEAGDAALVGITGYTGIKISERDISQIQKMTFYTKTEHNRLGYVFNTDLNSATNQLDLSCGLLANVDYLQMCLAGTVDVNSGSINRADLLTFNKNTNVTVGGTGLDGHKIVFGDFTVAANGDFTTTASSETLTIDDFSLTYSDKDIDPTAPTTLTSSINTTTGFENTITVGTKTNTITLNGDIKNVDIFQLEAAATSAIDLNGGMLLTDQAGTNDGGMVLKISGNTIENVSRQDGTSNTHKGIVNVENFAFRDNDLNNKGGVTTALNIQGAVKIIGDTNTTPSDRTQWNLQVDRISTYGGEDHITFNNKKLRGVANPTTGSDVVTLDYLERNTNNTLEGLRPKEAVRVATVAGDITNDTVTKLGGWGVTWEYIDPATLTDGLSVTYDAEGNELTNNTQNGLRPGTIVTPGITTARAADILPQGVMTLAREGAADLRIDNVQIKAGDRILIKDFTTDNTHDSDPEGTAPADQTLANELKKLNGIWIVKNDGWDLENPDTQPSTNLIKLRRAEDMDESHELMNGAYIYALAGDSNANMGFVCSNGDPITIEQGLTISTATQEEKDQGVFTDVLSFAQFASAAGASLAMQKYTDATTTLEDMDSTEYANKEYDAWHGPFKHSTSDEASSGALLMRAYGDDASSIALDSQLLAYTKSFKSGGRYATDSSDPTRKQYNVNTNLASLYLDSGDMCSGDASFLDGRGNLVDSNFENHHVLTVRGHIVLEAEDGAAVGATADDKGNKHFGTINSVQFSNKGDMYTNGSIECQNITCFSDKRLKKNVEGMKGCVGLVEKFRAVTYNWKTDEKCENPEYGFIAQEVQENFPSLVMENNAGVLSVDYMKICSILIGAVQELTTEVQALKAN